MYDNENNDNNENLVTLIDDDGNEALFEHLDTLEIDGVLYIVCVPYEENVPETEEVIIFEVQKDDEGEDCLLQVEDEDLLEAIYDEFKERNKEFFEFED